MPIEGLEDRCRAYGVAAGDGVVFCGPTAARLWGIPLPALLEDERLHVLQRWTDRGPRGPGIVGHKTHREVEVVVAHSIRRTAPIDTWFALAQSMGHDDLIVAGDRLVGGRHPLLDDEALRGAVAAHVGVRGARRIREAHAEVRPGSWSPRETRVRLALVRAGLPQPELNAVIDVPGARHYRGDLVYRSHRLVLEYEGRHHLTDPVQWARDLTRYNAFAVAGWTVIRIAQGLPEPAVVAEVRRILARRPSK